MIRGVSIKAPNKGMRLFLSSSVANAFINLDHILINSFRIEVNLSDHYSIFFR
jgi:hypothetical protein